MSITAFSILVDVLVHRVKVYLGVLSGAIENDTMITITTLLQLLGLLHQGRKDLVNLRAAEVGGCVLKCRFECGGVTGRREEVMSLLVLKSALGEDITQTLGVRLCGLGGFLLGRHGCSGSGGAGGG